MTIRLAGYNLNYFGLGSTQSLLAKNIVGQNSNKYKPLKNYNDLHDAKDLPDHLLHGGGPALVAGLAPGDALVPLDLWLAVRTYQMTIPTGHYLLRGPHLFIAGWALRDQGGGRNIPGTFSFWILVERPIVEFNPQCLLPVLHLSQTSFLAVKSFIQFLLQRIEFLLNRANFCRCFLQEGLFLNLNIVNSRSQLC